VTALAFAVKLSVRGALADVDLVNKYSEDQPRDEGGRWTSGGPGGAGPGAALQTDRGMQSQGSYGARKDVPIGVWAAHAATVRVRAGAPPTTRFRDPPSPQGRPHTTGRGAHGYTATGQSAAAVGELGERAVVHGLGFSSLSPAGDGRGPFDVGYGDYVFEVKTCQVSATEYKSKGSAKSFRRQMRAAAALGRKPGMMIVVLDTARGTADAYWREGLGRYRLTTASRNNWNYAGRVRLSALGGRLRHRSDR
jgi:hypothetical protein